MSWNIKRKSEEKEQEQRMNNAIEKVSQTVFVDSKGNELRITKEELENDYMLIDSRLDNGMCDSFYLYGEFVVMPDEKLLYF